MQIERILDGISRFGMNYPKEFAQRSAAVLHRLHEQDRNYSSDSIRSRLFVLPTLGNLLSLWLSEGGKPEILWLRAAVQSDGALDDQLIQPRMMKIRHRIAVEGRCVPLLSLPTHDHGWIDPRVFVRRLRTQCENGTQPCRSDLTVALLRLAPDFRHQAISDLGSIPEPMRSITEYACGAPARLDESAHSWAAEWLAAGRSRNPNGDLTELNDLGLPSGPNLVQPGTVQIKLDSVLLSELNPYVHDGAIRRKYMSLVPPSPTVTAGPRLTSAVLTERILIDQGYFATGWNSLWRASFWPARPDLAVAHAIPVLLRRMGEASSILEPIAPHLRPLLHAERGWASSSLSAICLALFSRDADARAVASDALIEGILDGRADAVSLGKVLSEFSPYSWAKLNRLTEALQTIGRVSHWAALVVVTMLEAYVAEWPEPPRDAHLVLSLLFELLSSLERRPSEAVIAKISELHGKNKSTAISARLIAMKSPENSNALRQALLEGVRARVERAERCR